VVMTMRLMDEFGLTPELIRDPATGRPTQIIVPPGRYQARDYTVEPDASNASYFLAAAAINKDSKITIHNLGSDSLQGDVALADLLHQMGADLVFGRDSITVVGSGRLRGIDVSLADMPDMAQTLAVVALFAEGATTLRDLHTLRVKETDRVAALATELGKLGASIDVDGDAMTIRPPEKVTSATIHTYEDHRMAMSFAVAGTRVGGIVIRHVECVNKTYPRFFDDFVMLGAG
jgi:3-phosphoshikimate 1-carboxyvinyltransferase